MYLQKIISTVTIIIGTLQIIYSIALGVFLIPQLSSLYNELDAGNNTLPSTITFFIIVIVTGILDVVIGYRLKQIPKSRKLLIALCTVILLSSIYVTGILTLQLMSQIISPIYHLTS